MFTNNLILNTYFAYSNCVWYQMKATHMFSPINHFFVFSFQRSGQNQGRCVCLGKDQAFYTSGVRTWQTHPVKNKNARILERIEKLSRPVVSGSFSKVRVLVTAQFKVYASRAFAHILHPSSRVWNYWNNSLVNFNFLGIFSANRCKWGDTWTST